MTIELDEPQRELAFELLGKFAVIGYSRVIYYFDIPDSQEVYKGKPMLRFF